MTVDSMFTVSRIGIVDNDPMTLRLLTQFLPKWSPGSQVIWFTRSGVEAVRKCGDPDFEPDVLLLDLSLDKGENGLDICRRIRLMAKQVSIIGITSFSLRYYARKLMEAGAQGLASKADSTMIAMALEHARHGSTFSPVGEVCFETVAVARERLARLVPSDHSRLSLRESEVLDKISQGYTYTQIAREFGVSESSVRTQTHRAVKKMGANTLGQAVGMWVLGKTYGTD